jgi:hypothetical protein
MVQRLSFLVIGLFWLTMNVLLWRAEYGPGTQSGSPVPVASVFRRILTAPDDSTLEIRQNGQRIGYCHWVAGAAEELVLDSPTDEAGLPDGMVQRPTAYALHVEGGILSGEASQRLRFKLDLKLTAEQTWRELTLTFGARPSVWEIRASAPDQSVELKRGGDETAWSRRFTFDELRDPRRLAHELGGPVGLGLWSQLPAVPAAEGRQSAVRWEARTDWLKMGATRDRAYRLHAVVGDRYEITALISRVGEIMRVDLPGGVSLVNEVLVSF